MHGTSGTQVLDEVSADEDSDYGPECELSGQCQKLMRMLFYTVGGDGDGFFPCVQGF